MCTYGQREGTLRPSLYAQGSVAAIWHWNKTFEALDGNRKPPRNDWDCWLCIKGQKSSVFHFALHRLDLGKVNQSALSQTLCDALDTGKSSFALCWYWHLCKNVVVQCTVGGQQRRPYGGGTVGRKLTLRLEHLLGSGSKRTWWHQPRQTLPVSYPLSALIFSMFSVLFFILSKKSLKTKQKKSIKTKNILEGKKQKTKKHKKINLLQTHHNTDRMVS